MATTNGKKHTQKLVVICGPESSGKSHLAELLSHHFKAQLVEEAARSYLEQKTGDYTEKDLEYIAALQMKNIEEASAPLVICDTDLLSILIWQSTKFGSFDEKMYARWRTFTPDLYLLCKPDIPWVYDPLRECEHIREDLYDAHRSLLLAEKKSFYIIAGSFKTREEQAIEQLNKLLDRTKTP